MKYMLLENKEILMIQISVIKAEIKFNKLRIFRVLIKIKILLIKLMRIFLSRQFKINQLR
jgi:hypothetical protein